MSVRQREAAAAPPRSLFATPAFLRLWAVGGLANAVLWLEILAASLFTFQQTGSATAVALVSAARAAPLLVMGAIAGVASDAWDRKRIVVAGLGLSCAAAAVVATLSLAGVVRPWHIAAAALVSGCVFATEMPARRRMVAESGGQDRVDAAVAADGLTGYLARCIGPLLGGVVYQRFGLSGAFLGSAFCSLLGLAIIQSLDHRQILRPFRLGGLPREFGEALRFALRTRRIQLLLAVTVTMNLCGYSYSTLMAPFCQLTYGLDATMTGVVAAAEPAGAFLMGLLLTLWSPKGDRLSLLMAGVMFLALGLLAAGLGAAASFKIWPVLAFFLAGGIGSAIYTNQQTSIVVADVPQAMRSRVMGLVTVCIGSWPIGMLLAGTLARLVTPALALQVLALMAMALVSVCAVLRMLWIPSLSGKAA